MFPLLITYALNRSGIDPPLRVGYLEAAPGVTHVDERMIWTSSLTLDCIAGTT